MNHGKSVQQSNDNSFSSAINNPMNTINNNISSSSLSKTNTNTTTIGLSNTLNSRPSIIKSDITNSILSNPLTLADRFKRLNEKQPTQKNDSKTSLLVTKSLFSNNSNSSNLNLNNSIAFLNKDNTSPIKPIRESIYVNNNESKLASNMITTSTFNHNNINDDNGEEDMSFTRLNSTIMTNSNTNNTNTINISIPNLNNTSIMSGSTFSHHHHHSKSLKTTTTNTTHQW
ncbi:predicted protein [Naegleria gruberi]|uniref:Predicted protein n=1 Tax=Naegleria gruberi TaxID=5762 RepID=D2W147_NAEGR|nr:uncharacterized protein NAEGRDRAFT_75086 [Naegleria gruberi]EFC37167.1 predicted protein [Naegleria gruberi]|eukprot:XP_002669911.1 predicted protein [Naegleria gruberi strain NEG-M]